MERPDPNERRRRLLVVDDDFAQAYLFEESLKELGVAHECYLAVGGKQALDFLRQNHPYENAPQPELIILDIHMPGMNGCEVLRQIKADPILHRIPVIMFSLASAD